MNGHKTTNVNKVQLRELAAHKILNIVWVYPKLYIQAEIYTYNPTNIWILLERCRETIISFCSHQQFLPNCDKMTNLISFWQGSQILKKDLVWNFVKAKSKGYR